MNQPINTSAFLLGQLFALADDLHQQYCPSDRDDQEQSPVRQLLGNQLMQTALHSPQIALDTYTKDLPPYKAWAWRTSKAREESPEVLANLLGQMDALYSEIQRLGIPEADGARMILGYLAKPKAAA